MTEPTDARYPHALGVRCDGDDFCDNDVHEDFLVAESDSRARRLSYALDYAARIGWQVIGEDRPETALTYCPEHRRDRPRTSHACPDPQCTHPACYLPAEAIAAGRDEDVDEVAVLDECPADGLVGCCPRTTGCEAAP